MFHDLLGGTFSMRDAEKKWLPQEPSEENLAYKNRLERSTLYNATGNTITRLVSKPYSKAITVRGTVPDKLAKMEDDVDRKGTNLTQFGKEIFEAGITYGLTHILVDYPETSGDETLQDEKDLELRPVFVHVKPPDLLSWTVTRLSNGKRIVTEVRIREYRTEIDGYEDKKVEYIRVIRTDTWELWKYDASAKDWMMDSDGTHTFGRVPIYTYNPNPTGFMTAEPPLEDLAHLNIAHWQSLSDQRNILRFARCGILFSKGFDEEEAKGIVIAPTTIVNATNTESDLAFVEHSGSAIAAGEKDLERLEQRMEVLGLKPLVERSAQSTATGKAIDESQTHSDIQAWIRGEENALVEAFKLAAEWMKVELPEDFSIDIYNEFTIGLGAADTDTLIKLRGAREITRTTLLEEMKRRGVLSEAVNVEDEIDSLDVEALDAAPPMPELDFEEDEDADDDD
jgi:hypothetical protein